jgi:hypothetical protein
MGFRKLRNVSSNTANLAYISTDEITIDDVEVYPDPMDDRGERRRILYADPSGRLFDEVTGSPVIAEQYPVVTDLFYDRDKDGFLDSDEVIPEAALPYKYRAARPYYGEVMAPSSAAYSIDASPIGSRVRILASPDQVQVLTQDGSAYTGRYVIFLEQKYTDGMYVNVDDGNNDPVIHSGMTAYNVYLYADRDDIDLFLKFPAGDIAVYSGNGTSSGTDNFNRSSVGSDWTTIGTVAMGNSNTELALDPGASALHNSTTVADSQRQFVQAKYTSGSSIRLLLYSDETDTDTDGMPNNCYSVTFSEVSSSIKIHKVVSNSSTQLKSITGFTVDGTNGILAAEIDDGVITVWYNGVYVTGTSDLSITGGKCGVGTSTYSGIDDFYYEVPGVVPIGWAPSNLDGDHSERVKLLPAFSYVNMNRIADPNDGARDIVASEIATEGYRVYVNEHGYVDTREFDYFFWRIKANITRTTSVTAIKDELIRVGIIGSVSSTMEDFLDGDISYSSRFSFVNPHPEAGSPWNVRNSITAEEILSYDFIVMAGNLIDWDMWKSFINPFVDSGGLLLIDTSPNIGSSATTIKTDYLDSSSLFINFMAQDQVTDPIGNDSEEALHILNAGAGSYITNPELAILLAAEGDIIAPIERLTRFTKTATSGQNISIQEGAEISSVKSSYNGSVWSELTLDTTPATNEYSVTTGTGQQIITIGGTPTTGTTYIVSYNPDVSIDDNVIVSTNSGTTWLSALIRVSDRIYASGLGLSDASSDEAKELFLNIALASVRASTGVVDSLGATTTIQITTPWKYSWLAGVDTEGRPILDEYELSKYGYVVNYDATTGANIVVRTLDKNKVVSQIVKEEAQARHLSEWLLDSDSISYEIDVADNTPGSVNVSSVSGSDYARAWTTKVSTITDIPTGWRWIRFEDEITGELRAVPGEITSASAAIVGTYTNTIPRTITYGPISLQAGYRSTSDISSPVEIVPTDVSSMWTWSDQVWTAPHIDLAPESDANLIDYGGGGITGKKWYPWDGNLFLLNPGDRGSGVRYLQNALNQLHVLGRSSHNGVKNPYLPLKVDGVYGQKVHNAVHWYQTKWHLTSDGVVDAGTAGHILRNCSNRTSDQSLTDRWNTYGPITNMVDPDPNKLHGRRTWINASIKKMSDQVNIYFTQPLHMSQVLLQCFADTTKSGHTGQNRLHITAVGCGLGNSTTWFFNNASNPPATIFSGQEWLLGVPDIACDRFHVAFYQDQDYYHDCKMWAFTHMGLRGHRHITANTITSTTVSIGNSTVTLRDGVTYRTEVRPAEVIAMGQSFTGYNMTAAELETAISASIVPASEAANVLVHAAISDDGTILIELSLAVANAIRDERIGTTWNTSFGIDQWIVKCDDEPCAHWPTTPTRDDVLGNWDVVYHVDVSAGSTEFVGAFYDVNTGDLLKTITDEELVTRGNTNIRVAILSKHLVFVDPRYDGGTLIPKRIAVKPFCVIEKTGTDTISHGGIDGTTVEEPWGLKIKTGSVVKQLTVPTRYYSGTPYDNLLNLIAGEQVRTTYRIESSGYSSTYGNPYTDAVGEPTQIIDSSTVRLGNGHIALGSDEAPVVSLEGIFGVTTETLEIIDIDIEDGTITFISPANHAYIPGTDEVNATYTYRREFISYRGAINETIYASGSPSGSANADGWFCYITDGTFNSNTYAGKTLTITHSGYEHEFNIIAGPVTQPSGAWPETWPQTGWIFTAEDNSAVSYIDSTYTISSELFDIFDCCPVVGHTMYISSQELDTTELIDIPVYVYALPHLVELNGIVISGDGNRAIYHTADATIFDPDSARYNPLAMLIAVVTMRPDAKARATVIDTRRGGGGIDDLSIPSARRIDQSIESFYDIGHMDGDAYLKGGTVVVTLPTAWKTAWLDLGKTDDEINQMAEDVVTRWGAAGKTFMIEWS